MTLLVRDEADIIEANLDFHLAHGVDHLIVTDNLSVDATRDLLGAYERRGLVSVIEETSDDFSQAIWVTRMARMADEMGADWVINNDADEFWWPDTGDLKSFFGQMPGEVDVVLVHRDDFAPVGSGDGSFAERMTFRKAVSLNANGQPLPPKAAHRAHPEVQVAQGNHAATAPGFGEPIDRGGMRILHFPVRSYTQFERKIVNGGRAYERNTQLPKASGSTWRHLYELWSEGRLPAYYADMVYDDARIAQQLESGGIIWDTLLRDWLRDRRPI